MVYSADQRNLYCLLMPTERLLTVILWCLLLQACGQTGPLYMPDSPPPIYVPKQEK
ncbi:LPS translocon maturation chaperone LptM [Methylomonas koyamae]|uniref:LPS translocon maturation chaperone LptM n=1 Tax=Methylomonas koyamae TaxID=702114 RepID=UPI000A5E2B59